MGNNILTEDSRARAAVLECSLFNQFSEQKVDRLLARSRLAITPETLSRILSKLKRDGIIQVSDKQVTLLDIGWLRKFVTEA